MYADKFSNNVSPEPFELEDSIDTQGSQKK